MTGRRGCRRRGLVPDGYRCPFVASDLCASCVLVASDVCASCVLVASDFLAWFPCLALFLLRLSCFFPSNRNSINLFAVLCMACGVVRGARGGVGVGVGGGDTVERGDVLACCLGFACMVSVLGLVSAPFVLLLPLKSQLNQPLRRALYGIGGCARRSRRGWGGA